MLASASRVGRAGVRVAEADAGEQRRRLADAVDRDAGVAQRVEVALRRRRERVVAAARACARTRPARRSNGRAITRPTASAPAARAQRRARRVELLGRHHRDVRGELHDRVLRGVEDRAAAGEVLLAVVVDRRDAVVGAVADDRDADRGLARAPAVGRQPVGVARRRVRRDDAHQLPVPGGRILAGPERVQAPVQRPACGDGGTPGSARMLPSPSAPSVGSDEAADRLRDVQQRVGARRRRTRRRRAARRRRRRR